MGPPTAPLPDIDLIVWLKLLFLPTLGALVLLAFLLEERCATAAATGVAPPLSPTNAAPGVPTAAAAADGPLGWLRSWCARAPRLTTAYQAQLQANAAALVLAQQQHAMHAHMAHMSLVGGTSGGTSPGGLCCGCSTAAGVSAVRASDASSPRTGGGGSNGSSDVRNGHTHSDGSSPFTTAPLNLNFNGFNHMSGSGHLLYYNTFATPPPPPPSKQVVAAGVDSAKPNGKHANGSGGTARKGSKDKLAATVEAAKPSSPRASSPKSASATAGVVTATSPSPPPPLSEFIPVRVVNERTGFSCTLSVWRGVTFAAILAHYVARFWDQEERTRYEGFEGGAGTKTTQRTTDDKERELDEQLGDDVEAALLEPKRPPTQPPTPPLMLCFEGVRLSPLLTPEAVFPLPPVPFAKSSSSSSSDSSSSPSSPRAASSPASTSASGSSGSESGSPSPSSRSPSSSEGSSALVVASLPPPPVLHVCVDYLYLFRRVRVRSSSLLSAAAASLRSNRAMQAQLAASVEATEAEIAALQRSSKEVTERAATLTNEGAKARRELERLQKELTSLSTQRSELESSMAASVGSVSRARAALESEYKQLRAQHDSLLAEHAQQKQSYQSLLQARHEASVALKQAALAADALGKRLDSLKIDKIRRDKLMDKIAKLEQTLAVPDDADPALVAAATAAAASSAPNSSSPTLTGALLLKHRYSLLESDHNVLNVRLNELRLLSHELDDSCKEEVGQLRYRLKQLDKDARELAKWKALARAHEHEAKESVRWKTRLKHTKQREKQLEREAREAAEWKARAGGMEKELRALRQWKSRMDAAGMGGEVPAFARVSGATGGLVGVGDDTLLDEDASGLSALGDRRPSLSLGGLPPQLPLPSNGFTNLLVGGVVNAGPRDDGPKHVHSRSDSDDLSFPSHARLSDVLGLSSSGGAMTSASSTSFASSAFGPSSWNGGFGDSTGVPLGSGGLGSGADVAASAIEGPMGDAAEAESDAEFAHNHPALAFLAE